MVDGNSVTVLSWDFLVCVLEILIWGRCCDCSRDPDPESPLLTVQVRCHAHDARRSSVIGARPVKRVLERQLTGSASQRGTSDAGYSGCRGGHVDTLANSVRPSPLKSICLESGKVCMIDDQSSNEMISTIPSSEMGSCVGSLACLDTPWTWEGKVERTA